MQRNSRILATFLLLATTVGCLRVCPSPQRLVSLEWGSSHCGLNRIVTDFQVRSTGLQFEVRRSERDLHVCVVVQQSH
jgi:hypothetical protein